MIYYPITPTNHKELETLMTNRLFANIIIEIREIIISIISLISVVFPGKPVIT